MGKWRHFMWVSGIAAALGTTALALGQSADGPLQRLAGLFGQKGRNSEPPARPESPARALEIRIELAWLADPVTFPYQLEARVQAAALEVHGTVPSQKVHDHALNIARLHSALTVVDATKENPSMTINPVRLPAAQLRSTAQTALREALPRQARHLQTECAADGAIRVSGNVVSLEQKLAASKALRRLHGCTSVRNLTQIQVGEEVGPRMNTAHPAPPAKKDAPTSSGLLAWFAKSTPASEKTKVKDKGPTPVSDGTKIQPVGQEQTAEHDPAPAQATGGRASLGAAVVDAAEPAKLQPAQVNPMAVIVNAKTAARLRKRIEETCPGVRDIKVAFTSATEVRIELRPRPEDDLKQLIGRILSLPEMAGIEPDILLLEQPQPKQQPKQ